MAVVLLATVLLRPSPECLERYDDAWCTEHAQQLADARSDFDWLVTDAPVGGYEAGDVIPTGHGDTATVPAEALDATAAAGTRLAEHATTHDEARLMIDLAACESRFNQFAANPTSSARGPWQFLAGTHSYVAAATGYTDRYAWVDQAANALWLGRHIGWWQWECLGIIRG